MVNVPLAAFVKVMSVTSNPVTGSENVYVSEIEELLVGPGSRFEVIATVGGVVSKVFDSWVAAWLPFVAESWATPAATPTVTSPSVVGMTFTV